MPFVYTVQENANKPLPTYRFLDLFFPFENAQLFPIEAYHVDLFERDDVDCRKEFYHGDRKMEVLKHGFAVEVTVAQKLESESKKDGKEPSADNASVFHYANGDLQRAFALLQHLANVYGVTSQNLTVKKSSCDAIMQQVKIVSEKMPAGRGIRYMACLPDGFVLAEQVATTLVAANNNPTLIEEGAKARVLEEAMSKVWELCGWEYRQKLIADCNLPMFFFINELARERYRSQPVKLNRYNTPVAINRGQ